MRDALAHAGPKQRPAEDDLRPGEHRGGPRTVASGRRCAAGDVPEARGDDGRRPRRRARRHGLPPREHRAQIASTSPIERLNGEAKRRSDVVGIVPDDQAVVRLVGALMLEQNDEWAACRRYVTLEGSKPASDDPLIELPAAAARAHVGPDRGSPLLHRARGRHHCLRLRRLSSPPKQPPSKPQRQCDFCMKSQRFPGWSERPAADILNVAEGRTLSFARFCRDTGFRLDRNCAGRRWQHRIGAKLQARTIG